jgi:hypothetical protein
MSGLYCTCYMYSLEQDNLMDDAYLPEPPANGSGITAVSQLLGCHVQRDSNNQINNQIIK